MICYGVSDTIGSYGFGYIIKYLGRIPCFVTAACLNLIAILIMLFWKATPDNTFVLYLIAVIWGLGDAVWQTQINCFLNYFKTHFFKLVNLNDLF
jgi:predicted MFS family arabinose efflux permease